MTHTEREELQDILIDYIEHPRKMGGCMLSIEDLCRRVHERWTDEQNHKTPIEEQIMNDVSKKHDISIERIKGKRRSQYIVKAREEICHRMYDAGFSYADIARAIGKHASSVIYTLSKDK